MSSSSCSLSISVPCALPRCHFWVQLCVTTMLLSTKLLLLAVSRDSQGGSPPCERALPPRPRAFAAEEWWYPGGLIPELPSYCAREADTRPRINMAKDGRQPTTIAIWRIRSALFVPSHRSIVKIERIGRHTDSSFYTSPLEDDTLALFIF